MTLVVGVITWWPERLIWDFNTATLSLTPQQNWSGPTAHHCEYYFFFFLVCSVDGYVTTNHRYLLEVSVDDISSKVFMIIHTYIHICIHTDSHIHTSTLIHMKFCLQYIIVVIWWYLIITSLTNSIFTFY